MKVFCRGPLCESPGTGLLAVSLFEDERPLRGSVGLLDWRLAGRLSQLLREGKFHGRWGEMGLLIPGGRFFGTKILVEGLGPVSQFTFQRFKETISHLMRAISDLKVTSVTLSLPGLYCFSAWGKRPGSNGAECSEAVKVILLTMAGTERNDQEMLLHLIEEEGLHDEVLLGIHKARVALKEKKITLELIESSPAPP